MFWDHDLLLDHAFWYSKLLETEVYNEGVSLYNESDPGEISLTLHLLGAVLQNHEFLDFNYNWSQFFGIVFVLYFLKWSGTSKFWKKLRETDNANRKMAIIYQKLLLKVGKPKMDLKFFYKCKNENLYPQLYDANMSKANRYE